MERIYSSVYALQRQQAQPFAVDKVSATSADLQTELKNWRSNLPKEMDFDASNQASQTLLPYNLSML
jgi:hypothetical protein